ncbi:hypothetical protein CDAR_410491 [Caerostris darwini]|uniref:Uncharacterized protein n=1 Tax=Caerostris darwini TaxID=1538125 RepID=A0AAV4MX63_9ARAC|nr:hypothetical protein CDAR_410491 [Caerostris darwini]
MTVGSVGAIGHGLTSEKSVLSVDELTVCQDEVVRKCCSLASSERDMNRYCLSGQPVKVNSKLIDFLMLLSVDVFHLMWHIRLWEVSGQLDMGLTREKSVLSADESAVCQDKVIRKWLLTYFC